MQRQEVNEAEDEKIFYSKFKPSAPPSTSTATASAMTPTAATATTNGRSHHEGPRKVSNGAKGDIVDTTAMSMSREASSHTLQQSSKQGKLSPFLDTSPKRNSSLELKGTHTLAILIHVGSLHCSVKVHTGSTFNC